MGTVSQIESLCWDESELGARKSQNEPEWARDHPETLGQAILLISRGFGKFEFAVKDPRTIWERVPTPAPTDREHQGTAYT